MFTWQVSIQLKRSPAIIMYFHQSVDAGVGGKSSLANRVMVPPEKPSFL
jgi:hypothetical protein